MKFILISVLIGSVEMLGNQRFFAITLRFEKNMARAGGSVGKTSTILLYITTSDLCCGLRGLYEGDAILAGKVLVAHAHSSHSSVILLGKNVERSPFNLNFFRNGDKWNENLSSNSTLLLDFWICFSRSREPKRLKSVLGGFPGSTFKWY